MERQKSARAVHEVDKDLLGSVGERQSVPGTRVVGTDERARNGLVETVCERLEEQRAVEVRAGTESANGDDIGVQLRLDVGCV